MVFRIYQTTSQITTSQSGAICTENQKEKEEKSQIQQTPQVLQKRTAAGQKQARLVIETSLS